MCRQEARLVVVALQPSVVQPASPIALLRRPPLVRPSRSPLFSATLACKVRCAAASISDTKVCTSIQTSEHDQRACSCPIYLIEDRL